MADLCSACPSTTGRRSRGLCMRCYQRHANADTLDRFPATGRTQGYRSSDPEMARHAACERKRRLKPEVREQHRASAKAYRANPANRPAILAASRRTKLRRQYGLTDARHLEMYVSQGAACGLCNSPQPDRWALCVDHCHATGRVRGLLCRKCNTLLGYIETSINLLTKVSKYLYG